MENTREFSLLLSDKDDNLSLLEKGNADIEPTKIQNFHRHWILYAFFAAVLLLVSLSEAFLWSRYEKPNGQPDNTITLKCGKTPEEARSLGCQLDVMVYAWTPPPCLNNTHALMYFHSQKWPFWKHENRTEEIPAEDILAGKYERYFSTWPFHGAHCQYLLSRNLQVLPTGGPLNDYMRDREHNTHCFDEVRAPTDPRRTLEVGMAYSSCDIGK
ncbi:hypothetical protein ONS95_009159 [Cadophora gregata]|uniref:uncharacterized protein n=1 Tax=Cadophora gregata TaxID=51156 RepID=UPI0026DD4876|nr:uncharacterized protein ONS95_009159 [Cadophora gregata]KAK0124177.1 hypothetical protein ONS95_009159 [Cadophora gregata]KAK0130509.1 hypothetical protein ONS96_001026 [Cadophora gregata f. sp. sojae]